MEKCCVYLVLSSGWIAGLRTVSRGCWAGVGWGGGMEEDVDGDPDNTDGKRGPTETKISPLAWCSSGRNLNQQM